MFFGGFDFMFFFLVMYGVSFMLKFLVFFEVVMFVFFNGLVLKWNSWDIEYLSMDECVWFLSDFMVIFLCICFGDFEVVLFVKIKWLGKWGIIFVFLWGFGYMVYVMGFSFIIVLVIF